MNTWASVGVGALAALAGAWGAQFISALMTTRRTLRERQHENFTHWRDKRLEVYLAFLELMSNWGDAIEEIRKSKAVKGYQTDVSSWTQKASECDEVAFRNLRMVEIIGSQHVYRAAENLWVLRAYAYKKYVVEDPLLLPCTATGDPEDEYPLAIREDLGIEGEKTINWAMIA